MTLFTSPGFEGLSLVHESYVALLWPTSSPKIQVHLDAGLSLDVITASVILKFPEIMVVGAMNAV